MRSRNSSIVPRLKVLGYNFVLLALLVFVIVHAVEASASASPFRSAVSALEQPPPLINKDRNTIKMASNLRGGAIATTTAPVPRLLYGTAWKKERTQELVELAVRTGFRGIDTACQPKHYYEPGVGAAMQKLIADGVVKVRPP